MQLHSSHNDTTRKEKEMKQYRKKGRTLKKPSKTIFEMYYYNPSITIYELADLWDVQPSTIYKWACEFRKETSC